MKKSILIISALVLGLTSGFAQDSDTSKNIHIGFKVGANLANVYDTDGEQFNADPKYGLAAGLFLSIPIGEFLGVQPEILFSQKGYQTSGSVIGIGYNYTHTSNYIDVPLLFAFKPVPMVTILAGPQYSFLISEKNEFTNTLFTDPIINESDFENNDVRKNTLGFVGGVDVNVSQVVIGARVGWDILNNNGDGTTTTPRYKNMMYQLTLGFRL